MAQPTHLYDLHQTFEENVAFGPFFDGEWPKLPKTKVQHTFLGQQLNSLFGIAACPLTVNARAISVMSRLGYDILTYKSVRSVEWHGNPFPHWLYVDASPDITQPTAPKPLMADFEAFNDQPPTMVNSFGIHSFKPEYWQADVAAALQTLNRGQLLILSLMPTPIKGQTLIDDAQNLAKLAVQTKAPVFEVNLACPNTDGGQGLIYEDLELTHRICVAMKKVLGNRPLLVKVGYYQNQSEISTFLAQNRDVIAGVSSTNTYSMPVVSTTGKEVFPGRPSAGVSGAAIKKLSQAQAKTFVTAKQKLGWSELVLIGIGGVVKASDIDEYLNLGVDAVQTAVGAWHDPYLAAEYKQRKGV